VRASKTRWAILVAAAVAGCDSKPAKGPSNPAPLVDPTGSVQVYKTVKHEIGCENNLRQIHMCLQTYTNDHGSYPEPGKMFQTLIESNAIQDFHLCAVPRAPVTRESAMKGGEGVYRTTADRLNDATPGEKPIVWDSVPFQDGRHVLLFGGTVEQLGEEQFQKALSAFEGR